MVKNKPFVYKKRRKIKDKGFGQSAGQTTVGEFKRSGMSRFKRQRGSFYRKYMGNKHYKKRDFF